MSYPYTHRNIIVPAAFQQLAQGLCEAAAEGDAGKGMFTTGYTLGKENGASAGYFMGRDYGSVYSRNAAMSDAELAVVKRWLASKQMRSLP